MNFFLVLFVASNIVGIYGHGRLMDPPSRNAMWREGYRNPPDYNDSELFCGGLEVQVENGGKCGVCGDNYADPTPRAHEDGGKYGRGIITREYKVGDQAFISVEITANHLGRMEIRICPRESTETVLTQECLDSYPLNIVGEDTYQYSLEDKPYPGNFTWYVELPPSMTCSNCVIQWTYVGANNWGTCDNGTEGMGCGPQETFKNCADVSISASVERTVVKRGSKAVYYSGDEYSNVVKKDGAFSDGKKKLLVVSPQVCQALKEEDTDWCRLNCMKYPPECPVEKCKCVYNCVAIGEFAKEKNADFYCTQNCLKYPSFCPKERCECS
ncbi:UNVERIFIED_CONTAM: hypothetical protein RMT77_003752 [Armadillidium vulgare]